MELLQAKATTTQTTDLGEFRALVSVFGNVDRGGDVVHAGAFTRSIEDWKATGRLVPLHYNHDPDEIIGEITEMWESDHGLQVSGRVDLDEELGRKVWKSLKRGRIGFSFGFLTVKSRDREDGGKDLLELDVVEISVTASPMNNRTRVLSTKSAVPADWKDEPRYQRGSSKRLLSYRQLMLELEVKAKAKELETEERTAEAKAKAQAEEERARQQIPTTNKPYYADDGARAQHCHAPNCLNFPTKANGVLRPVRDRRWWCPEHRDQAGPEDHLPPEPTYIPRPGSIFGVMLNPASEEAKRVRAEFERQQEEKREREALDEREREAFARVRERYEDREVSISGRRVKLKDIHFS